MISVVLPGVQPGILKLLFPREPVHIFVKNSPTGLSEALPQIFAALGEELPADWEAGDIVQVEPVAELLLELTDSHIAKHEGVRRATATAELTYYPADAGRTVASRRYKFQAPLGPVELEEIRWYVESYFRWPAGVRVRRRLPNRKRTVAGQANLPIRVLLLSPGPRSTRRGTRSATWTTAAAPCRWCRRWRI